MSSVGYPSILQNISPARAAFLCRDALARTATLNWNASGKQPGDVLLAPKTFGTGDKSFAEHAYRGTYRLDAGTLKTGAGSPFAVKGLDPALAAELNSFAWLNHMHSSGSEIARLQARALIADWLKLADRLKRHVWQPPITARRLLSWLEAAPFVLTNASARFEKMFLRALSAHLRYLAAILPAWPSGPDKLSAAAALAIGTVCLSGHDRLQAKSLTLLERELESQILPDGGHVSRSPGIVTDLLRDLTVLAETFITRQQVLPDLVIAAIDRMASMVRFFQLGDRALAFPAHSAAWHAEAVDALLARQTTAGQPLAHARHSAYHRLAHGPVTAILDAGAPAPGTAGGSLCFELSDGVQRLIVNTGPDALAQATATLEDRPPGTTGRLWQMSKPFAARSSQTTQQGGTLVEAEHDGYLGAFGMHHRRRLYLSETGSDIRGEDIVRRIRTGAFANRQSRDLVIRFPLHPAIRATGMKGRNSVLLIMPDRTGWTFSAGGARIELAATLYREGDGEGAARRAQCITLHARVAQQAQVKWALKRQDGKRRARRKSGSLAPGLPLDE
jgi:uncharacterized heparinase superfamily protein